MNSNPLPSDIYQALKQLCESRYTGQVVLNMQAGVVVKAHKQRPERLSVSAGCEPEAAFPEEAVARVTV